MGLDDDDVADRPCDGRVLERLLDNDGDRIVEVERRDQMGDALVDVDRTWMHHGGSRGAVDGAEHATRGVLDNTHCCAAAAAQVGEIGRPLWAGPEPPAGPATQPPLLGQGVDDGAGGGSEECDAGLVEGQLRCGRAQVGCEHVGVVRIEHGCLDRAVEDGLGMMHEVAVERVVACDEDAERG